MATKNSHSLRSPARAHSSAGRRRLHKRSRPFLVENLESRLLLTGLTINVDSTSPWPAEWYSAAVANMQTVVNMYNAYGDFTTNNPANIYVYYNSSIPTEQSGYGGWGGSIGVGGTYPNVRVLLHESSH